MQQLIRMLSNDPSMSVRTRSLGALSSLIRHFPFAQRKFVDLGGLQALTDLLHRHSFTAGMEKLCVKAVTLVGDLLHERVRFEILFVNSFVYFSRSQTKQPC
jgi:nucleotide exchange factor SIL1